MQYGGYLALDEKAREKLVKRYVRKSGRFWRVAVSRYEVRTTVSPEFTRRMAFLMDDFHTKFTAIFRGRFKSPGRPKLDVLADAKGYASHVSSIGISAGFSVGMYIPSKKLLVAYKMDDRRLQNVLFHEGTHQLLHAYTGRSDIPVWFNEGVATNFETWDLSLSAPENVRMSVLRSGRRRTASVAMKSGEALSADALIAFTGRRWNASPNPTLNYAMAWSLVNYLLSTPRGQKTLNVILLAIYGGKNLKKLLPARTRAELNQLWHEDMRTRLVLYDEFVLPAVIRVRRGKVEKAIALANEAVDKFGKFPDSRFWRGRVLADAGRWDDALEDLVFAQRKDSNLPGLYAYLGRAYLETGNKVKAKTWLRKAVTRNAGDKQSAELLKGLK